MTHPDDPPTAGHSLRRALDARDGGESDRALQLLQELGQRFPVIADHAMRLRLEILVGAGRFAEARKLGGQTAPENSPFSGEWMTLLGNAAQGMGDSEGARSAWERALDLSVDDGLDTVLLASLAESLEGDGLHEEAARAYLRLWIGHPLSERAEIAEARLDVLEERLGREYRTPAAYRRQGEVFFRRHRNEPALEAFDTALAKGGLSSADQLLAQRRRADTLFRLRRYSEASVAYAGLPQDDDIRIARARSVARAGNVIQGAHDLEEVGKTAKGTSAARANFLAGVLFEGEGHSAHAEALYRKVVLTGSREQASAALWRLGWSAYVNGRYEGARSTFERLASRQSDAISGLRARYWHARALERLGREAEAEERFAGIAEEFPLTYYGWRSRGRVETDRPMRQTVEFGASRSQLREGDFRRARILLQAGLEEDAQRELNHLFRRARSLDDRTGLADLYASLGEFHRPQRLMVDAYTVHLARGPDPREIDVWWHAWPSPFPREVRGVTESGRLQPEVLYAIMREESGYRPGVVSVSGARGLLQLMPRTAERVARREAMGTVAVDDLFQPSVNIRLGGAYLEELLGRFDGRASAAIASYNAGPDKVSEWLTGDRVEDDEWVEGIPYEQTRGYVKRVLRSVHAYRVLY